MGFSNVSGCTSIRNYEQAARHWNSTPEPGRPGGALRVKWAGARPLDDSSKWHYRLERHENGGEVYYDVCLYHTVMARFYKPEADGTRRAEYTKDSRSTSHLFMWHVTGSQDVMGYDTPEGRHVLVPVAYETLGTTVVLDSAGRILLERSSHQPIYKVVSSPEQKEWRKKMKASMASLLLLFGLGKNEMVSTPGRPKGYAYAIKGRPFSGNSDANKAMYKLRGWDGLLREDTTHGTIDTLRKLYEACLQGIIDKRDYAEGINAEPVKPDEVARSMLRYLEAECPQRATRKPIPNFPEELKGKWSFV